MDETTRRLNREELITANEHGWGRFLHTVECMSGEKRAAYLQQQGYDRMQNLLAHVIAWHEETLRAVPTLLAGERSMGPKDVDEFNARAVERYRSWDESAVESEFTQRCADISALVRDLPESALEHEQVYEWLYVGILEHYKEHRPV